MNYIRHLTNFFEKVYADNKLNQSHVSLYIALFQFWNINRFENPFPVNRVEVQKLSKISSLNTYHRILHELEDFGYIHYFPSHNPMKSSMIMINDLDASEASPSELLPEDSPRSPQRKSDTTPGTTPNTSVNTTDNTSVDTTPGTSKATTGNTTFDAKSIQLLYMPRRNFDTSINTTLAPLLKQYKHINNKLEKGKDSLEQNKVTVISPGEEEIQEPDISQTSQRKKVSPKKESVMPLPELSQVIDFFREEHSTEFEARKFFNHFESNGWKVGGKSPMKNWQASARNWILNIHKYSPGSPSTQSNMNTPKNYGEPL
jgi:hypothetical protein